MLEKHHQSQAKLLLIIFGNISAYDLATQCPSRRASMRRHTVVACAPEMPAIPPQSYSVPQSQPSSRPGSRLSHASTDTDSAQLGNTLPEMSWSRTSLQDEFIHSVSTPSTY